MADIVDVIKSRMRRGNLNTTLCYTQVYNKYGGYTIGKYVGKFVRSYSMGSGDGTTIHWEFDDNGTINVVCDQMYGSCNGDELTGFIVSDCQVS